MRPVYINVRARSPNEGSGTVGRSPGEPVPACFPIDEDEDEDEEVMNGLSSQFKRGAANGALSFTAREVLIKS